MTEFLAQFGYLGMFISALLAGSVLPFNSEVVIGALKVMGLDPWILLIAGTVGNVLGGLFNYWIGTFGRMDWIEKYLHIKEEKIERAQRFMAGRGALMAFFAFVPIIGSARTDARQPDRDDIEHDGGQVHKIRTDSIRNTTVPINYRPTTDR